MKKVFVLLFAAVILYYWPYTPQSFLIWDDEATLSAYKYFNPVNLQNFLELWLQPFNGLFTPVLKSLWAGIILVLQATVGYDWGQKNVTLPFILIHILLHVGNGVLVYKLALNILTIPEKIKQNQSAVLVALAIYLFHPLQIENINWIMGTKELLWIHFALWSLLFWTQNSAGLTFLFFLLSILSKPTAVILIPLYALVKLLDNESLLSKKNLSVILPSTMVSALLVIWTERMQPSGYVAGFTEKLAGATDGFGFYAAKIIWPFPLSADYGRNYFWLQQQGWTWAQAVFILTTGLLCWVYLKFPGNRKLLLLLSAMYYLPLITTSGIIGLSFQAYSNVADHYASFSLIPLTIAFLYVLNRFNKKWLLAIAGVYLIVLTSLGWSYKVAWAGNKTLFEKILSVNSNSFMANNNLGLVAAREGQFELAVKYFEEAYRLKPDFTHPLLNLFSLQTKLRHFDYLKDLSGKIDFAKFNDPQLYSEYASYLQADKRAPEAESALLKAIALKPEEARYYYQLAGLYFAASRIEKAKLNFKKASELEPGNETYRKINEQVQKL